MLRVFLLACLAHSAWAKCPYLFELAYNGECHRQIDRYDNMDASSAIAVYGSTCNNSDSRPVIIANQEDNDYWTGVARTDNDNVMLGIKCDGGVFKWTDGSKIEFKPNGTDHYIDMSCDPNGQQCMWYITPQNGSWQKSCEQANVDMYCVIPYYSNPNALNEEKCNDFIYDDQDKKCYKVIESPVSWSQARQQCIFDYQGIIVSIHDAQENSFVRRMAVSRGLINGLHLGATTSTSAGKVTNKWEDESNWDYDNFSGGYPVDGLGNCLAMDTNKVSGQWINLDCDTELPFACKRDHYGSEPNMVCDQTVYEGGGVISSPGYPDDASIPCDFILKVDPGKRVKVEVSFLEANTCCDRLVLTEGPAEGGDVIAILSGEISGNGNDFYTRSQNIMRASWQPKGGKNVKGMVISFYAI